MAAGVRTILHSTLLHFLLYCLADLCAYVVVNLAVFKYSQDFSKGLSL